MLTGVITALYYGFPEFQMLNNVGFWSTFKTDLLNKTCWIIFTVSL